MRDVFKTIEHIERTITRGLERAATVPEKKQPPSPRVWRAPTTDTNYPEQVSKPKDKPVATSLTITARALKVTAVLDVAAVATLPTPEGQARSDLVIACDGQTYIANIATKSLRKAKATIAANGAENTFVMVQGKLRDSEIAECGLVAQAKVAKTDEIP
jgi:hypothetical protein